MVANITVKVMVRDTGVHVMKDTNWRWTANLAEVSSVIHFAILPSNRSQIGLFEGFW